MSKRLMHKANVDTLVYHKSQDHLSPPDHKVNIDRIFQGLLTLINKTRKAIGLDPYTEDDKIILYTELCYTEKQHQGRWRKDGKTPYFQHLLGTVYNLVKELKLTSPLSLVSGLHHDDIEDLELVQQDASKLFAPLDTNQLSEYKEEDIYRLREKIRDIILGVTKVRGDQEGGQTDNEASFRRLLETIRDHGPRVAYVKMADRANNSDTFSVLSPEKRQQKARETLALYVPLARICKVKNIEDHLLRRSLAIVNPTLLQQYNQLIDQKKKKFDASYKPKIQTMFEDNFPFRQEIADIQFVSRTMAQSLKNIPPSLMETLELKDLPIDRFDPCVDIKITLHTRKRIKQIKSYIIDHFSPSGASSQQVRIEDKKEEGFHIHLVNKDLGGHLSIKINDAISEQRSQRGILANLMDATTPEELKNSIDYILLQPGNIFKNATEELLQPPIYVYTPDGERKDLPMNATALDFAFKIHTGILLGAQRAFIDKQPCSLFDPLPNGVTVSIESCLKRKEDPQKNPLVQVDPGWPLFCKNRYTKELLTKYLKKDKKKSAPRGKQFIQIVSSILQLSPKEIISLIQKNIPKSDQEKKILQDIGETKIDLIALLSKEEKYTSPSWNISVIMPDSPGELYRLWGHFKQICNITDIQIKTVQQEEKSKEVTIHLDFTPPELPEYKRLKPYQILTTFLKLHYEGYDIKATPLPLLHHTSRPRTNSIK